ncbi:hypothetical protein [Acetobacter pasteurianus]|uniref:Uncharacterized protein n=1 Tax=Acetobacter pasteurianus subsp. pasteurianus TaxID=481145 RepID=A0A1Y0XY72_ACEPA|nr:hypothetical protein [Acetobacter pasteurianus]ARW47838.1 hypothetical protein S1001342_01512 [Acetobacter pasteurianus subsp. pasteurianus]
MITLSHNEAQRVITNLQAAEQIIMGEMKHVPALGEQWSNLLDAQVKIRTQVNWLTAMLGTDTAPVIADRVLEAA